MDKIDKFTKKLGEETALHILHELHNIRIGNTNHLDVKKLRGVDDVYRARIGKIRIKFIHTEYGNRIIEIGFRNDNTY